MFDHESFLRDLRKKARVDMLADNGHLSDIRMTLYEKADGRNPRMNYFHRWLKVAKRRHERRKAKRDPETPATYGKYQGYET